MALRLSERPEYTKLGAQTVGNHRVIFSFRTCSISLAQQVPTPLRQHARVNANILEEVMRRKGPRPGRSRKTSSCWLCVNSNLLLPFNSDEY